MPTTNVSTMIAQFGVNATALSLFNTHTLNVLTTGSIIAGGTGSAPGVQAGGSNIMNIDGLVFSAHNVGINVAAGANTITIGAPGTVFGLTAGIAIAGATNTLNNSGAIGAIGGPAVLFQDGMATVTNSGNIVSASEDAVRFNGANNTLTNTGYIEADLDALQFSLDNNTVINTGTLRGEQAVDFDGSGGVNSFFNAGTMIGLTSDGYDGSSGQDLVVNNGLIQGAASALSLSGGNDVYDGRNGTVSGDIQGGSGDDILWGGAAGEHLLGGANNDQINGYGGADTISGGDGVDLILGGAGGDVISGGLGGDLFGFNVGDNGDLIQNFNEGGVRDGFDLRGYFDATGFAGNDPRGAGIMQVLQNGADTDVYLHGAFAFRIEGVVAAAIDDTYFLIQ